MGGRRDLANTNLESYKIQTPLFVATLKITLFKLTLLRQHLRVDYSHIQV